MVKKISRDRLNNAQEEKEATLQKSLISKLNDDCLINIFKFLPYKDRIIAEQGMIL